MKYSNLIKERMDRIEAFTDDLALEQARLATSSGANVVNQSVLANHVIKEDSKLDELLLFPSFMQQRPLS